MSKDYTQRPWDATTLSLLAGPTDLAALLGLSRPSVVTNWRGRYQDFPSPRTGGGTPQYDVVEVMRWLRLSGSRVREVPVIAAERWWEAVTAAFQVQSGVPTPRPTMVGLVLLHCVLHRDLGDEGRRRWSDVLELPAVVRADSPADPSTVVTALVQVGRWAESRLPSLAGLLAGPIDVPERAAGGMCDLVRALQWFHEHRGERDDDLRDVRLDTWREALETVLATGLDGRPTPARVTGRSLAALVAALAEVGPGSTVLDPAAGEAGLLLAASRRSHGGRAYGQEIDPATWLVARSVLAVHRVEADLAEPGHNSLTDDCFPDVRADAVLVDPPVGAGAPPLDLWVEHGLRHLAPGGRLVIAVPMGELVEVRASRRTANARLVGFVEQLAHDHRIDAVVAVPRGARRDVVGPVVVLVVSADRAPRYGIDVGVLERLPGERSGRRLPDHLLDEEATDMVARLDGRGSAPRSRPGGPLHWRRVEPEELFVHLSEVAVELEMKVAKGPRSAREPWELQTGRVTVSRMMAAPDAMVRRPEPDRGTEIVQLAYRLLDALHRDRSALDDKQVRGVLNAVEDAQRLVEPLLDARGRRSSRGPAVHDPEQLE